MADGEQKAMRWQIGIRGVLLFTTGIIMWGFVIGGVIAIPLFVFVAGLHRDR